MYRSAGHRILILGAGFGGLTTALELEKRIGRKPDVSVLVVDRDNSQMFTPLLWTVASGRTNPNNVVVPIRAFQGGRGFHALQAEVERIDLDRREVHTSAGVRPYDQLVIARGRQTIVPDLPGLRERALTFQTAGDAVQLRNHVIDAIEAAHNASDPADRRAWSTFIVSGGGDTGVELAATIREYLSAGLFARYPWLEDEPARVVLVGRSDRLVPVSSPKVSERVLKVLEKQGVEVLTGVSVEAASDDTIATSQGEIPARTLFWAAGTSAPDIVRELPVEHARNGSLIVDDHLRVVGHPEVHAIGDAAWIIDPATGEGVPPTAQAAQGEAKYIARSIAADLDGEEFRPYEYGTLGHLSLLGKRTGVAEVGPLTFSGLPAWVVWHGAYLLRIGSWRKRIRLLDDWTLAEMLGRETSQLRLDGEHRRPGPRQASEPEWEPVGARNDLREEIMNGRARHYVNR
jgi:NADH dehydrogenase